MRLKLATKTMHYSNLHITFVLVPRLKDDYSISELRTEWGAVRDDRSQVRDEVPSSGPWK